MRRWLGREGKRGSESGTGIRGDAEEIVELPVEAILFNPHQPRTEAGSALEELCESIREHGVVQPVIVRRTGAGYELVAGERRVRASKMAGRATVPAVVRDYDDRSAALVALVENLQRSGLHPLDEAEAYRRLIAEFGLTQAEIARMVGLSQPAIANKVRLLKLADDVKAALRAGSITERHGRALLRKEEPGEQVRLLRLVLAEGLSVEETERLVAGGRIRTRTGGRTQRRCRVKVFKDVRLFVNSFREAVSALRRGGIDARLEERITESEVVLTMRIPRIGGRAEARRV
ncbi:MAG: ParB/RepB/Spo0J family partition protein [Firmicutes bacterium]|nr:ParB/RepB/Spo0J family partition protein [Bacillota bacterium]